MTYRFPEMWFVQGLFDCDFDEGVDQLTLLFARALGLREGSWGAAAPSATGQLEAQSPQA
jgi:hypothetical protein